jgi:hypothetical protein
MKPNTLLLCVVAALMLSIFVIDAAPVSAKPAPPTTPAAGAWIVSEEDTIEGLIPQYQLEAPTGGYALLQSDAVKVSGFTRICHPYRGGQFGWTSEIRALTSLGWVGVPTTSGWEPDEEGHYMTCANVGSGTYAVFGYWDKPAWWDMRCPPDGYSTYVMDVTDFWWFSFIFSEAPTSPNFFFIPIHGKSCGPNGTIILENDSELDFTFAYYCCNDKLYRNDLMYFD